MQVQDDPGRGTDLDLRHYLRVVARRRWVIILIAVALGAASMGWAFTKEERYRASAELLLLSPNAVEADAQAISDDPDRAIANEIEIFGSEEMQASVTEV
ncbi:MAG TPA: Wzz/FepE/Etk N-terminal domain-containing protein, partial [Acidimicrobiales bacterium]|nr:Wzz/FepE/Etk N-terminal domain-containing protein [Acidimicrobiales bacterium]